MEGAAGFVGGERGEGGGVDEGRVGEDGVEEIGEKRGGVGRMRCWVSGGEEEGQVEGVAFGRG